MALGEGAEPLTASVCALAGLEWQEGAQDRGEALTFALGTDTSLFAFGTHSKKRPHNLVLGRMFDAHLLDMFELALERAQGMAHFAATAKGGASAESKPLVLFHGE